MQHRHRAFLRDRRMHPLIPCPRQTKSVPPVRNRQERSRARFRMPIPHCLRSIQTPSSWQACTNRGVLCASSFHFPWARLPQFFTAVINFGSYSTARPSSICRRFVQMMKSEFGTCRFNVPRMAPRSCGSDFCDREWPVLRPMVLPGLLPLATHPVQQRGRLASLAAS